MVAFSSLLRHVRTPRVDRSKPASIDHPCTGGMEAPAPESNTDSFSSSQLQQPSPLLSLPAELRCAIYAYILTFSHTLRLQDSATAQSISPTDPSIRCKAAKSHSPTIYRKQPWFSDNSCTALLLANRTLHNEALPVFYSANTFHFPALLGGITPSLAKTPCIELIQHASIDFSYTVAYLWMVEVAPHVDPTLAACIQQLLNACPALQSLTLHIPSNAVLVQLVGLARYAESATIYVLSSLKCHLHRLSIIGRGHSTDFTAMEPTPPFAPIGLCTMIAPRAERFAKAHEQWPCVSVDEGDFREEKCNDIAPSRNVAEGFVTISTGAIWGFDWERGNVGMGAEERVAEEDRRAEERVAEEARKAEERWPVERMASLWGW